MDAVGVDRVVIVPPSWEGERNDLALEAAQLHPDWFAIMGRLAVERPESRALVPPWRSQPGRLGVRLTLTREHHRAWLSDGTADWFWQAERHAIPVVVSATGSLPKIAEVAVRYPELRLVIDHLGLEGHVRDEALGPALDPVVRLAPYANIAVKASALPCYVTEAYPFPSLHPHIQEGSLRPARASLIASKKIATDPGRCRSRGGSFDYLSIRRERHAIPTDVLF